MDCPRCGKAMMLVGEEDSGDILVKERYQCDCGLVVTATKPADDPVRQRKELWHRLWVADDPDYPGR